MKPVTCHARPPELALRTADEQAAIDRVRLRASRAMREHLDGLDREVFRHATAVLVACRDARGRNIGDSAGAIDGAICDMRAAVRHRNAVLALLADQVRTKLGVA